MLDKMKQTLLNELDKLKKKKKAGGIVTKKEIEDLRSKGVDLGINARSNNFNMKKANETGKNLAANAMAIADATADNAMKFGEKISEKTVERDAPKLDRVNKREKDVNKVIDDYRDVSDNVRRKEITEDANYQKQLAGRQANITAAKAGANGVELDEGQKMAIKDDIIAKYGQNILTADQYELENQRKIDDDLKNIGIKEFEIQDNIDKFKDAIRDNAYAPILNALDEAKRGNQKAIDDIGSFFQEIVRKKGIEEGDRGLQRNRLQDTEQEFQGMDLTQKSAYIRSKIQDIPGAQKLGNSVEKIIQKNPGASFSFIIGELARDAADIQEFDTKTNAIFQKSDEDLSDIEKEFRDNIMHEGGAARVRGNPHYGDYDKSIFEGRNTTQGIRDGEPAPTAGDTIEEDRAMKLFKDNKARKIAEEAWKKFVKANEKLKVKDYHAYKKKKTKMLKKIKDNYLK